MEERATFAERLADIHAVVVLSELIGRSVVLKRRGPHHTGLCPFHHETTASFTVTDSKGMYHCFGCGATGDAIDFMQADRSLSRMQAVEAVEALYGLGAARSSSGARAPAPRAPLPQAPEPEALRWSPKAESLWGQGVAVARTIAATYFRERRCIEPSQDADVRFLPATNGRQWPAIMSRIADFATGEPLSLHFTLLKPDGSGKAPVERPKLLLAGHRKKGGVIRLCDDADLTIGLGLAEGLETALSVGWSPCWATVDAGNMASLPVIPGIESLTIFADHDRAGIEAADALVQRWRDAGRTAVVVMPRARGQDFNDMIQAPVVA